MPFRCLFKDLDMGMSKGNVQMVNVYNLGMFEGAKG